VARFASRHIGAYRALLFMQLIGFFALSAFLIFTGGWSHASMPGWQPWTLAAAAGVLNTVGSLALYYSFEVGILTVVAPISSSYPVITVGLAFLSGEHIGALHAAGLAIAMVGVMFAANSFSAAPQNVLDSPHTRAERSKGVGWSLVSMVCFGIMFWFLGFHVLPVLGATPSVWVIRLSTSLMLLFASAPAHQNVVISRGNVWWLLALMGVLDTSAYVANNAALQGGPVSITTVIASLYGAVTVLLSSIFLRERLARLQWLGIVLIFAGIILVSL
jgi:drug/metabolite transporter (DMT)-like permease